MPRRGLAVGVGTVAVGAVVLGGVTAGNPTSLSNAAPANVGTSLLADRTTITADDVAQAVPAADGRLVGFAPPADPADERRDEAAQFRIAADLPAGPLGIPGIVLKAYKLAATRVAAETPACKLPWFLLAGIGRIESGHAGNGNVNSYGDTLTSIRGPVLDGSLAGNAVIVDSDGGDLDGDRSHDRAMGPMQFIPSTWAQWGTDANGDDKADPDNIFDATLSAGRYLCAGVTDFMAKPNQVANVMRYNHSVAYAQNVLGWAAAYATGVMPTSPIPEMSAPKDDDKNKNKDKKKDDDKKSSTSPSKPPSSSKKPAKPKPTQQCLGVICLPPNLLPQQPAPKKKPPKSSQSKAPAGR